MFKNKIIFISALDWGLGHATRCISLIKQLQKNNTVIIGITPTTRLIFDDEFPELQKIDIEPYNITYSKKLSVVFKLILNSPRILSIIKTENKHLKKIIEKHKIDVVISDNRLGLYNSTIECIYITHQVNLQAGLFSKMGNFIHHYYIKKYNQIWIPDFEDEQKCLAGKLSRNYKFKNVTYINPLSRLTLAVKSEKQFDYLILLSGPEPKRTELEMLLFDIAIKSNKKIGFVRGTKKALNFKLPNHIEIYDLPNATILAQLITNSETIICRSGYSTLMDLYTLNKNKLILIPTPSQTEQEYLAKYWEQKYNAQVIKQSELAKLSLN